MIFWQSMCTAVILLAARAFSNHTLQVGPMWSARKFSETVAHGTHQCSRTASLQNRLLHLHFRSYRSGSCLFFLLLRFLSRHSSASRCGLLRGRYFCRSWRSGGTSGRSRSSSFGSKDVGATLLWSAT
jgi:hypothetical protein